MDYIQATLDYLRAHDMPAGLVFPHHLEVPMFDIVSTPRPFKPNEAMALQEVMKAARQYFTTVQRLTPNAQAVLAPSTRTEEESVAIRFGVYGHNLTSFFVVGPEGGDVMVLPRPEVVE